MGRILPIALRCLEKTTGEPVGSERNDGDLSGTHLALFVDDSIQAIARLDEADNNSSQVRFVAVDQNCQGLGFGRLIMEECEQLSRKFGKERMILHARENALKFYERLGYKLKEKSHLLFGQIQHYLMIKEY